MTFQFGDFLAAAAAGQPMSEADNIALRRHVWDDDAIGQAEVDHLFAINDQIPDASPAWDTLFIEAVTAFVVYQMKPRGYVDDAGADWLMTRITAKGKAIGLVELKLLVHVLKMAAGAPTALRQFALREIEQAVITGTGPTRAIGDIRPGVVDAVEIDFLRELVFAPAGDGALMVGKDEAEMLFRIKDATLGADNAAGWTDLFVRGVANHVMALANKEMPLRERAAESEAFWARPTGGKLNFLGQIVRSAFKPVESFRSFQAELDEGGESAENHDQRVTEANQVTVEEASLVRQLIDSDGKLDPLEKALITFIEAEGQKLP